MAYSHFNVIVGAIGLGSSPNPAPTQLLQVEKPMDAATIQAMIEQGLPGAQVAVSGDDGVHFEAEVVAEQFAGKLPLARHRLVYATLGDLMGGAIHALALKTLTPQETAARR